MAFQRPSPSLLAALCIFNGLKLAPIHTSPLPELRMIGNPECKHFRQVTNYLSRFFKDKVDPQDYCPIETLGDRMAAAPWIRGGLGVLQHLTPLDIPDADTIDPAIWFNELDRLVALYCRDMPCPHYTIDRARCIMDAWQEPDFVPVHKDSRQYYVAELYAKARTLQSEDAFISLPSAIARARKTSEKV